MYATTDITSGVQESLHKTFVSKKIHFSFSIFLTTVRIENEVCLVVGVNIVSVVK